MNKLIAICLGLVVAGAPSVRAADARENFNNLCAKCHGEDGQGQTKMGRKLAIKGFTDPKVQAFGTDDEWFKVVKEGLKNNEGKVRMNAIEGLSDDEIKSLVQYVRSFKK